MRKILKSAASLVTGLALAAPLTATALPADAAATTCSASFSRYKTTGQGSQGAQAKAVECLLSNAGFRTTVDGRISAADAAQIAKFRSSVGMSPLRVVGPQGWSALLAQGSTPALRQGARGASVLRLQRSLQALGWTSLKLSGSYDARTAGVVKTVQRYRKQSATGTSTDAVWRALQTGKVPTASAVTRAIRKADSAKRAAAARRAAARTNKGAKALAFAKKQIGDRYRYGATGPNAWDCSGLTGGAWKAAGKKLPRTSQAQFRVGKKVSKSNLKKGDLVFFYRGITHVAIYAGNGNVIHASRPGKPVGYLKMKYMPYQGARRPA